MTETDGQTDLRAIDREIAELMGYTVSSRTLYAKSGGDSYVAWYLRAPDEREYNGGQAEGGAWGRVPAYSSTWEGFGLMVEEALRRGWEFSTAVWGRAGDGVPQAFITWRGRSLNKPWERAGSDIPHAFALAMRDALKAAKEAA